MLEKKDKIKVSITNDKLAAVINLEKKRARSSTISAESIIKHLQSKGFACSYSAKTIERKIWDFLKGEDLSSRITVLADPVLEVQDCFAISLADDEMTAKMDINVSEEKVGKITEPVLKRILMNAGIHGGIDDDHIKSIIKQYTTQAGNESQLLIAQGKPEIFADDGYIDLGSSFRETIQKKRRRQGGGYETVQAKATGFSIPPNSLLCTVYPPQKGIEGVTITGKTIWSEDNRKTVKSPRVTVNRNIEEKAFKKRTEYISQVEGRAFFFEDNNFLDMEEAIDGRFEISIKDEGMKAVLLLQSPAGGKPINPQKILDEIKRRNLKSIVPDDRIVREVDAINEFQNQKSKKILLAEGTKPENGKDEKVYWNINLEKIYTPKIENNTIDYKGGKRFPFVRQGQVAGVLFPPTKGVTPGIDVYGKESPPKDGNPLNLDMKNCFEYEEGVVKERKVKKLRAKLSGLLQTKSNVFTIDPVFETKIIDYSTGNVDFDGTIVIKETIQDGFKVKSSKDLHINNTVGACMIESEGNIIIKGGMNGRGKGHIKADGNVIMKYAENCTVEAENIIIESHCILSKLVALNEINVGMNRKKGKIIGCDLHAKKAINVDIIGGEKASEDSSLWCGIDRYEYLHLVELTNQINDKVAQIATIDGILKQPKRVEPEELEEKKKLKEELMKEVEELTEEKTKTTEKAYCTDGPVILVRDSVQEHNFIKIAAAQLELVAARKKTRFYLDGEVIKEEQLKK